MFLKTSTTKKPFRVTTTTTIIITLISTLFLLPTITNSFDFMSPLDLSFNASTTTWASYMARLCGRECRNGELYMTHYHCVNPECFMCNCHPSCKVLGTCCPTFNTESETHYYDIEHSNKTNPLQSLLYNMVSCYSPPFSEEGYIAIKTCPPDWNVKDIRENCEHAKNDSMDSLTPFSDKKTGLVFQNAHCAICNGFRIRTTQTDTKTQTNSYSNNLNVTVDANYNHTSKQIAYPWTITIKCFHYQNLYSFVDKLQFYLEASKLSECKVKFEPPFHKPGNGAPTRCSKDFDLVQHKECTSSDATINQLCDLVPKYFALRFKGHINVFCYMCQERKPIVCIQSPIYYDHNARKEEKTFSAAHVWELPPMVLLFNPSLSLRRGVGGFDVGVKDDCQPGHWRNDKGDCVPAGCSPGKILDNSTCDTAIADVKGLAYNLSLVLVPKTDIDTDDLESVLKIMHERIANFSRFSDISIEVVTAYCPEKESNIVEYKGILEIKFFGFIIAPHSTPRDEFERGFNDDILKNDLECLIEHGDIAYNLSLRVACNGHDMCEEYVTLRDSPKGLMEHYAALKNKTKGDGLKDCVTNKQLMPKIIKPLKYQRYTFSYDKDTYIDMNPSLSCPYMALNMTSMPKLKNGILVFTVSYRNREIVARKDRGMTIEDDKLLICLDILGNLAVKTKLGTIGFTERVIMSISYISEIVCMILSILCLLMSLITYLLFPALRALPGLNNMCLCFSLLTAQIALLITSTYGTRGRIHETHCLVHAIVLHYSWLASICWMNTCCIHMFRVFTGTLGPGALTEKKTFRHYCIYSFGIPCLITMATIITTWSETERASLGYNNQICFLDVFTSMLIPILSLLVPFGISILVNLTLFCFTVVGIVRVTRHTPASTKSSHGISAYVKLSTLTGLFIAVTATAVFSGNAIFTLISGPLAALQGVFIFFSFIFNKHVLGLYKELCLGRQRERTSSMTSSNLKTNKISSTQVSGV